MSPALGYGCLTTLGSSGVLPPTGLPTPPPGPYLEIMAELAKAIRVRYNAAAGADLKAILTGGLHLQQAPQETPVSFPYGVLDVGPEVPDWTFRANMATLTVDFLLCSKAGSAAEILELAKEFKSCFDEAPLVIGGWHLLRFWREESDFDQAGGAWLWTARYNCSAEQE